MRASTFLVIASLGFIAVIRSELLRTQPTCPELGPSGSPSPFDGSAKALTNFGKDMNAIVTQNISIDERIEKYELVFKKYCSEMKNENEEIYQIWSTCYRKHGNDSKLLIHRYVYASWGLNFGCDNQAELLESMRDGKTECNARASNEPCENLAIEKGINIPSNSSGPYDLCTELRSLWENDKCKIPEINKCGTYFQKLVNYQAERILKCNGTNKENFERSVQYNA